MSFRDLDEFFRSELRLPIRGREYVVPSPDAETGLWAQRLMATASKAADGKEVSDEQARSLDLSDDEERGLYGKLLGPAFDEMVADKIPWEHVKHAGMTALIWTAGNTEAAEQFWNSGGVPDPPNPPKPKGKSSGSGKSTRKQGSTSGTSFPTVIQGQALDPGPNS